MPEDRTRRRLSFPARRDLRTFHFHIGTELVWIAFILGMWVFLFFALGTDPRPLSESLVVAAAAVSMTVGFFRALRVRVLPAWIGEKMINRNARPYLSRRDLTAAMQEAAKLLSVHPDLPRGYNGPVRISVQVGGLSRFSGTDRDRPLILVQTREGQVLAHQHGMADAARALIFNSTRAPFCFHLRGSLLGCGIEVSFSVDDLSSHEKISLKRELEKRLASLPEPEPIQGPCRADTG